MDRRFSYVGIKIVYPYQRSIIQHMPLCALVLGCSHELEKYCLDVVEELTFADRESRAYIFSLDSSL